MQNLYLADQVIRYLINSPPRMQYASMPPEVREMLAAAGVLNAMPEGPPAPRADQGYFDSPGPTWEWPEVGPGDFTFPQNSAQTTLRSLSAVMLSAKLNGDRMLSESLLHCIAIRMNSSPRL